MDGTSALNLTSSANSSRSEVCAIEDFVDQQMYPAAYSLFFIIGLPANCLSLYVACVLVRKQNNLAVYLVNLSLSDLLYTLSLPVWIRLALRKPVGDTLCSAVAVVMYNSFYVGSGLLCCISVDRYLAVVYPLHFNGVREVRSAAAASAAVWCGELLVHVCLLHHTGALRGFSARRLCEERAPMAAADARAALVRASLGFLIPLMVMGFCFMRIMVALRGSASLLASERRKIGRLLLLLLLTYAAAFSPYQVVMLLRGLLEPGEGGCGLARRLRDPYLVLVAATTLNSTLDPIIYCLISQSARREMERLGEGCWKRVAGLWRPPKYRQKVNTVTDKNGDNRL